MLWNYPGTFTSILCLCFQRGYSVETQWGRGEGRSAPGRGVLRHCRYRQVSSALRLKFPNQARKKKKKKESTLTLTPFIFEMINRTSLSSWWCAHSFPDRSAHRWLIVTFSWARGEGKKKSVSPKYSSKVNKSLCGEQSRGSWIWIYSIYVIKWSYSALKQQRKAIFEYKWAMHQHTYWMYFSLSKCNFFILFILIC